MKRGYWTNSYHNEWDMSVAGHQLEIVVLVINELLKVRAHTAKTLTQAREWSSVT